MAALDIEGVIEHGERERTAALDIMLIHADRGSYCGSCGQAWMCHAYVTARSYLKYWDLRIEDLRRKLAALTEPTAELAEIVR